MSLTKRLIARLDIKPDLGVVKGVRMEGLRVVGDPHILAAKYTAMGADELLYMDVTASLYQRNSLLSLIRSTSVSEVWVPMTVGGGIRSVDDVQQALRAGADKVAINTAATERPALINECVKAFGSQCIVGQVDIKRMGPRMWPADRDKRGVVVMDLYWNAMVNNGRDAFRDAVIWIRELVDRGVGELLITSVDHDGTRAGMDYAFLNHINVEVPVVLSGGCSGAGDVERAFAAGADGIAIGRWLHDGGDLSRMKDDLDALGVEVRV